MISLNTKNNTIFLANNFKRNEINLKENKDDNLCHHIVDFYLNLLGLYPTEVTNKINESIVLLDKLARSIDSRIDNIYAQPFDNLDNLSIDNIEGLRGKITKCVLPIKENKEYKKVLKETFKAIEESFEFNTHKRHMVYDLKNKNSEKNITMNYLLPLFSLLNENKKQIERSFYAISTYIQVLDDYLDLIEDVSNYTTTPVTKRYYELTEQNMSSFKILSEEVILKLGNTFKIVEEELFKSFGESNTNFNLDKWKHFQHRMNLLTLPQINDKKKIEDFLSNLRETVPPMLCYS